MTETTKTRWRLDGKRAVVTGATKGIGAAVAGELLGLGASVLLAARTPETVSEVIAHWREAGYENAHGIAADVATPEGRASVVEAVRDNLGGLDILVNNVGTNIRKASLDYDASEYEKVFQTNLESLWELCRALHPALSVSGTGCIVNIGSVAGSRAVRSGAPYAMTKAAIDQLTRYLAVEWAEGGIRVNAVNPWYTRTPLANAVLANPEFEARVLAQTPSGYIAEAGDISGAVAFLCLPVARHITGQTLAVDGGFSVFGL